MVAAQVKDHATSLQGRARQASRPASETFGQLAGGGPISANSWAALPLPQTLAVSHTVAFHSSLPETTAIGRTDLPHARPLFCPSLLGLADFAKGGRRGSPDAASAFL